MIVIPSRVVDPYDAVIADLRTKRDELSVAIRTLETLRDGRLGVSPATPTGTLAAPPSEQPDTSPEDAAGMFLGMSIVDASKKLLKLRKRPLTNTEILRDLQAGGVVLTGSDPLNVVGSVLTRRFHAIGDVVRISRGTWGLKEWYPGRNFKPSAKTANAGEGTAEAPRTVYELRINDLGGSEPDVDEDDDL